MPWMKSHAVLAKNANHSVNIVISLLNPAGFKIRRIKNTRNTKLMGANIKPDAEYFLGISGELLIFYI